jgi:adenosylmethionine-8-amino-7-oxononanoate aminotransferase
LRSHPNVGDIRGMGLLIGIEFVKDKSSRESFPPPQNIAERIRQAALEENVLTYPAQGCVDGLRGDHILLAPPFIFNAEESALIARAIKCALAKVFPS